jgi:(1->4)-alpha-D-glucan 1-alpha-D-glucosylmutase
VRHHEGEAVLVVAVRLTYTLCGGDDARWSDRLWKGTLADLEPDAASRPASWRNWLTGEEHVVQRTGEAVLDLQQVFAGAHGLPFAVLVARTDKT